VSDVLLSREEAARILAREAYDVGPSGPVWNERGAAHAVARTQLERAVAAVRAVQGPWNAIHEEMRQAILVALGETEKKP
jgi:hypothetical protein